MTSMDPRMLRAWGWTAGAMVAAALTVVLLALPLRPGPDESAGWAELGWIVMTGLGSVVAALVGGAAMLWWRLSVEDASYAGQIALMFLPATVVLAVVTGGVGVLAGPPVAWWLVHGLHRRAQPGWGEPTSGMARWRATGVWPRAAIALVVAWTIAVWLGGRLGSRLGGEMYGEWQALALCLPVVAAAPVLLLVRRAWPVAVAVAVLGGVVATFAVMDRAAGAHLSTERLDHTVAAVGVPDGTTEVDRLVALRDDSWGSSDWGYDLPVVAVGADAPVPPDVATDDELAAEPAATARGQEVAREWTAMLRDHGWETSTLDPSLMPGGTQALLDRPGTTHLRYGMWVETFVVPIGDGAVLICVTRP